MTPSLHEQAHFSQVVRAAAHRLQDVCVIA